MGFWGKTVDAWADLSTLGARRLAGSGGGIDRAGTGKVVNGETPAEKQLRELAEKKAKAEADQAELEAQWAAGQEEARKQAAAQQAGNRDAIGFSNRYGETYSPEGIDQTNKGVGEQQWGISGGDYFEDGDAKQWTDKNAGTYGRAGFGETTNRGVSGKLMRGADDNEMSNYWEGNQGKFNKGGSLTRDAYNSFDADVDPNLGAYYQNAFDKGASNLNRQLAARGQFGSSRGMQQMGQFAADLEGERANREADYKLRRFDTRMSAANMASGDERSWATAGADVAGRTADTRRAYLGDAADTASTAEALEFSRLGQAYDQRNRNDQFGLSSRNSGFAAAFGAQDQRDERIQDMADNQFRFAELLYGAGNEGINRGYDAETTEAETGLASATDDYNARMAAEEARQRNIMGSAQTAGAGFDSYLSYRTREEAKKKKAA